MLLLGQLLEKLGYFCKNWATFPFHHLVTLLGTIRSFNVVKPVLVQKLKDEATDIRLSAELASKKALEVTGSGPASSSRLRIREVLERQRLHSLDRSATQTVDTVESLPFGSGYNSRLWVFR